MKISMASLLLDVVRMSIFTLVDLLLDLLEDNICETSWQLMLLYLGQW